jgi:hypothetical protein
MFVVEKESNEEKVYIRDSNENHQLTHRIFITWSGREKRLSRGTGVARIATNEPLPLLKRRKTSQGGAEPDRKTATFANCDGANNPGLLSSVEASQIRQAEDSGESFDT